MTDNQPPIDRLRKASGTVNSFLYTGDGNEVVVPLDIAISLMGEGHVDTSGSVATSPANPSEISVVDTVRNLLEINSSSDAGWLTKEEALEIVKPYLRTTEPVSVSLENMCKVYMKAAHPGWNPDQVLFVDGDPIWKLYDDGVAAVLDAAGVKYE